MKILNLDKTFYLSDNKEQVTFNQFKFPGGEIQIRILQDFESPIKIISRITNSDDIMTLLLATDALKRMSYTDIHLFLTYLPYARQDKVKNKNSGEALAIDVFCKMIESQSYKTVEIFDPHSDVAPILKNPNTTIIDNKMFVEYVMMNEYGKKDYILICPDQGAYKKIWDVAQHIEYTDEIVMCNKLRDVVSGHILETKIYKNDFQGKDVFIIDDICDGGSTFIQIAKELKNKNVGNIYLIVSHGIFSQGEDVLKEYFTSIYATDSFKNITSNFIVQVFLNNLFNFTAEHAEYTVIKRN